MNDIRFRVKNLIDSSGSLVKLVHGEFIVRTVIRKFSDTCTRFENGFRIWSIHIDNLPDFFHEIVRSVELVEDSVIGAVLFVKSASTLVLCKDCLVAFCDFRIRLFKDFTALLTDCLNVFL